MASGDQASPDLQDFLANARWVQALAQSLVGRADEAEDLAQDVWVTALRHPAKARYRSWLSAVVRNLAVDRRRRAAVRSDHQDPVSEDERILTAPEVVAKGEVHRRIVQVVLELPEPYRSVVLQRFFEGLPTRKIAEQTGIPFHTVRTHLQRGLDMLRTRLQREWGTGWRDSCLMLATPGLVGGSGWSWIGALIMGKGLFLGMVGVLLAAALLFWGGSGPRGEHAEAAWVPKVDAEAAGLPPVASPIAGTPVLSTDRTKLLTAVPVDPERQLSGIVVTTSGVPIAGATVVVVLPIDRQVPGLADYRSGIERELARAVSDEHGAFGFELDAQRIYDLVVEAEGYAFTKLTYLYAGNHLRVELAAAAAIFGRVLEAGSGSPLEGVEIEAKSGPLDGLGNPRFRAISTSDGGYRLDGLPAGFFNLRLSAPEHSTSDHRSPSVVLAEGEQVHFDLELDRAAIVRGRVTDAETKEPIAGATVNLRADLRHIATTDMEGRFALAGVPVGFSDAIVIRAPGYGEYDYPLPMVPKEGLDLELGLLPGRRAFGRVVDWKGEAVVGAYVTAGAYLIRHQYGDHQNDKRRTRTDSEGRFELTDLRVDLRHTLLIGAEGHATAVFDFPADEWNTRVIEFGDIALEPSASLAGRVIDTQGLPLEGLWVDLRGEPARRDSLGPSFVGNEGYQSSAGFGFGTIYARTDARGRYAFTDLPAGDYILWAGSKGYARGANGEVELAVGEQAEGIDLVLDAGLSIEGKIVDSEGSPLPGTSVSVYQDAFRRLTYNFARADGSFTLSGLDAGDYTLELAEGFARLVGRDGQPRHFAPVKHRDVPAGRVDLRLVFPEAGPVSGVVLGPDNRPVGGAVLSFLPDEDGLMGTAAVSSPDGRFTAWIETGTRTTLRVQPPFGNASGAIHLYLDDNGNLDESIYVTVADIPSGTSDLIIRLPKLP